MRVEGWEGLLHDHIVEAYRVPFTWERHNCALWCADWIFKATGNDAGAGWRGKFTTERGAYALLKRKGFKAVSDVADSVLSPIPLGMAKRGDLVLHPNCDALGICAGRHAFFKGRETVEMVDTLTCAGAWTV